MEKNQLIQIFKFENIIMGIAVTLVALFLAIWGDNDVLKGVSIGMAVGVWIGVLLNHFVKIPKVFGRKDERELILTIIATSMSTGASFVGVTMLLSMSVVSAITLTPITFVYTLLGVAAVAVAVRFISYKLLDNNF